ncbi:MAG: Ig-like domain-containing protein [Holophagaceae bacterium]|nr:Ig-like domain-containing protein [Holophagaceae bacterium]
MRNQLIKFLPIAAVVPVVTYLSCSSNNKFVEVTGISLDRTSLTLGVDKSEQIQASVQPSNATNQAVSWSSTDVIVARVDSEGVVTAMAPGSAVVTATTKDGGFTATCKLTVPAPVNIAVSNILFDRETLTLAVGQSETLNVIIQPSDATNQGLIWASDNTVAARIIQIDGTKATISAYSPGEANIIVTSVDGGKTATCKLKLI